MATLCHGTSCKPWRKDDGLIVKHLAQYLNPMLKAWGFLFVQGIDTRNLTMQIYVCINCYMEENLLPGCLSSIRSTLPQAKLIVIDGAYQAWINAVKMGAAWNLEQGFTQIGNALLKFLDVESTDATHKICKEYNVEHLVLPNKDSEGKYVPWKSEAVKRNEFFRFGEVGDYFFVIDGDEVIQGVPDPFIEDAYNIMLQRDDNLPSYAVQRIFKKTPDIKIEGAHHAVWQNGQLLKKDDPNRKIIGNTRLMHYYDKRNQMDRVRHIAKGFYYRDGLMPEENEFRGKHNI